MNDAIITGSNNNVYNYATHYNINDFGFSIVQVGGSPTPNSLEVWVRIYNANNGDPALASTVEHANDLTDDPPLPLSPLSPLTMRVRYTYIVHCNALTGSAGDLSPSRRLTVPAATSSPT